MNGNAKILNLSAAAEVFSGYALRTSVDVLDDGETCMIQLKNVNAEKGVIWSDVAKIDIPTKKEPRWLRDGDILFAARSANNFAVALESAPAKTLCVPHFFVIRVKSSSVILPHFLAWQINQSAAQAYFEKSAVGTTVANIRRQTVENLSVTIPPLETQELIVRMAKAALAEKMVLEKLIANREQQMNALAARLISQQGNKAHG